MSQERLQNLPTLPIPDPQPHTTATGFLDLPFELRLQIYHYLIPHARAIDHIDPLYYLEYFDYFLNDDRFMNPHILLLSKQISNECLDILYGENFFKVQLNAAGEYHFKRKFMDKNRRRMKHIIVVTRPWGASYLDSIPDVELWASTLPYLKTFRFIAEQPSQSPGKYISERQKHQWIKWIGPYFKVFGRLLEDVPAIIEVDDDGREVTNELVDEYLPSTCQKIRCSLFGDFVFRRGRFSIESGYWDDDDDDYSMSSRDA